MHLTTALLLTILTSCKAPVPVADTAKPSIYIIGVLHSGNSLRTTDSLLAIIKAIKPDLILSETDTLSGEFNKDNSLAKLPWYYKPARKLGIFRALYPEEEVRFVYQAIDSSVVIRPFDMPLPHRNKFIKNRIRNENKFVQALQKAHAMGEVPDSLEESYKTYIGLIDFYVNLLPMGYRQLNTSELTDSMRSVLQLEEKLSRRLIDHIPSLASYQAWQTNHYGVWEQRNQVMVSHIERFIYQTRAKRVVVITGLMHKYYFIDALRADDRKNAYVLAGWFSDSQVL